VSGLSRVLDVVKWIAALGSGEQNFLGAWWVTQLLARTPEAKKHRRALQILSLSPHYFIRNDKGHSADGIDSLEQFYQACRISRERIADEILAPYLLPDDIVLDLGCGPGFLSVAMAAKVQKVIGFDISPGAIACAKVLDPAPNVEYISGVSAGLDNIPDDPVDVVVSFAVIQHLTENVYVSVASDCYRKLKPGGRLILQVQLPDPKWRSEQDWRSDRSLKGRLKFRYGVHCFARTDEEHRRILCEAGFTEISIQAISSLVNERFDDVCDQYLITAKKA
jgi:2-polyprenyl-3-methyl-5-hydroxy-6-metoxy-1,4-benzoquinol methylase